MSKKQRKARLLFSPPVMECRTKEREQLGIGYPPEKKPGDGQFKVRVTNHKGRKVWTRGIYRETKTGFLLIAIGPVLFRDPS